MCEPGFARARVRALALSQRNRKQAAFIHTASAESFLRSGDHCPCGLTANKEDASWPPFCLWGRGRLPAKDSPRLVYGIANEGTRRS